MRQKPWTIREYTALDGVFEVKGKSVCRDEIESSAERRNKERKRGHRAHDHEAVGKEERRAMLLKISPWRTDRIGWMGMRWTARNVN